MDEDIGDEGNSKRLQQSLLKAKVYIKPVYIKPFYYLRP